MVNVVTDRGRKIYKCEVCGFGYLASDIANKCQAFARNMGLVPWR